MHVVKYVMEKLISLGARRSGYLLMLMLAEHNISNLLLYFMCVCLCVPMGPVAGTEWMTVKLFYIYFIWFLCIGSSAGECV